MSPVAILMIHNPATVAMGDTEAMKKAIGMLNEVKESIINAYELKSGMDRAKISKMMDSETWLNAKKAVELGFADEVWRGFCAGRVASHALYANYRHKFFCPQTGTEENL